MSIEEITIISPDGVIRAKYQCKFKEKRFNIQFKSDDECNSILVQRHDILLRDLGNGQIENRVVVGVSVMYSYFGGVIRILAPKLIGRAKSYLPYMKYDNIELRAGAAFIGGRATGFYDGEGVIIEARHIGGDPEYFEDWAYFVIAKSNFGRNAPQWILLDDINFAIATPSSIVSFDIPKSITIDSLIEEGEKELLAYLASNPALVGSLTGEQLEDVMVTIYKNIGFNVEKIGKWNQADGGVDIIAISKTDDSTEFRLAIQCKTSKNAISARPLRELAGVLGKFQADQGIVATTSRFTGPALQELNEGHMWRLEVQDREDIVRRLLSIVQPDFRSFIDDLESKKY